LKAILFGSNFGVEHWNSLSLRERARVRGCEQEHYFLSLILTFSRWEKEPIAIHARIVPNTIAFEGSRGFQPPVREASAFAIQ
jgi:hypothetical protein